jgi:hypothetical protein
MRSGIAAHLGRPRSISLTDCNVSPPIDVPFPRNLRIVGKSHNYEHTPSTTSLFLSLYAIYHEVEIIKMEDLERRDEASCFALISNCRSRLEQILEKSSGYLRATNSDTTFDAERSYLPAFRLIVQNTVHVVIMDLQRRYINLRAESRNVAIDASLQSIAILKQLYTMSRSVYHRTFAAAFYTVTAATLISAIVVLAPHECLERRTQIEESLEDAKERMSVLTPTTKSAKSGLDIVRMCLAKVRYAYQHTDSAPASQSLVSVRAEVLETNANETSSITYEMSSDLVDMAWYTEWSQCHSPTSDTANDPTNKFRFVVT